MSAPPTVDPALRGAVLLALPGCTGSPPVGSSAPDAGLQLPGLFLLLLAWSLLFPCTSRLLPALPCNTS